MNPQWRKPAPVLGAVVLTVAALLLSVRWLFPPEPTYGGKTLSAWAQQFGSNRFTGAKGRAATVEAEIAVHHIGTNAIPILLDLMRVQEPALKKNLRAKVAQTWHQRLGLNETSGDAHRIGAHGLAALGTNAFSAVPALVEIATHHPDEDGRYIAVFALRMLGPTAEPAIPFLIQCLTNSVRTIQDEAALGLGKIRLRLDIVVPALVRYLSSVQTRSDWAVTDAIAALARFGTNAKPAVPLLIKLLDHPDRSVRAEVTNQLPKIDPAVSGGGRISEAYVLSRSIGFLQVLSYIPDYADYDLAEAVVVLGRLGTNAQSATPLLVKLLNHPDPELRFAITNWLPRIDVEAAAKAGIPRADVAQ